MSACRNPWISRDSLALAAQFSFSLDESNVFAAQQREAQSKTAHALQQQQAEESRPLRNFIHG